MTSLWWWALPVLLLPILWHRQKREQTRAAPLATARFLPQSEPVQLRVWRWRDLLLLLLRCLLLAGLIALLADPVLPWRGDSVLVVPGTDPAFVGKQLREAGLAEARRIDLPGRDAYRWLHEHEREFAPQAHLLLVGDVAMPAALPRLRHAVTVRSQAALPAPFAHHVAVYSQRAGEWRKLFAALGEPQRYVFDEQAGAKTGLVIWDLPQSPPAGLRAPLWWVADASAFPELAKVPQTDGLHGPVNALDSPRGRLWSAAWLPPRDAAEVRTMFDTWQRLHVGVAPHTAPPQAPVVDARAPAGPDGGALRDALATALLVLFALERMLTHVRRR
ncbi:BatA domain-containing protein [Massilia sp. LXY-6]|uniref:BatA domain-containing protein n=1 Tax=Massilia sp. LXY-6 TaxID=3379823 RepID=UPI003EE0F53F